MLRAWRQIVDDEFDGISPVEALRAGGTISSGRSAATLSQRPP
jgi:hypothetical protein